MSGFLLIILDEIWVSGLLFSMVLILIMMVCSVVKLMDVCLSIFFRVVLVRLINFF